MAVFIDLEDSPMFHKQVCLLEQETDELKDRCQRLYKGCKSFLTALGEACNGDITFADSMEAFGGGEDDPVSLSVGGPILSKFVTAFRELATYKELLRSQVEHVLVDRVMQFMSADLQGAKDSRRRFDKSINTYDQAREKFASLKKSTREDVVAELEEDLHNSKSAFEKSRFNLVNALMNIEAKKKYEFLESFSTIMDAHLRYFKLGYDLLSQMEPLIHQVLTYAQQSKESAQADQDKLARRMQEFRTETERDNFQAASNLEASAKVDGWRPAGVNSYKDIQAMMRSGTNGEVRTIKQGYLLKRSSNLRGNWKRRFFVLDSYGALYYYRTKGPKAGAFSTHQYTASPEHGNGVFSRFRTRHNRSSSWSEENLGCHTVDLHTSTIKTDAEDTDLRLCFRIISPSKSYTLQAESDADRMDWVNKITGVITSLLNSHLFKQEPNIGANEKVNSSFIGQALPDVLSLQNSGCLGDDLEEDTQDVSRILREIPGNDHCAECGSAEPDWASLNLGVLLCIECSGVHRNLGVHISKVRSLTLDVKVWEPTILDLFRALGNAYCNSVWEELLPSNNERSNECYGSSIAIVKPCPDESFRKKEEYIQLKYAEKLLINKKGPESGYIFCATSLWGAVRDNNLREAYRLIVTSDANILNATFDEIDGSGPYADKQAANQESHPLDPASCVKIKEGEPENCLRGCSLLHVASHGGNVVMLELLLQFGADINVRDFHGRTPLHHCIAKRNNGMAKYLLRRGAHRLIKDWGGMTALERAMEMGAITDEELFILLAENQLLPSSGADMPVHAIKSFPVLNPKLIFHVTN